MIFPYFLQLCPQQRQWFYAPGSLSLAETRMPYKEAAHVEKMHTPPPVSLHTNTAAHCFPTAVNHINSEFDIHVSFCWSLYSKNKSFFSIQVHVVVQLGPVQVGLSSQAPDADPAQGSLSFSLCCPSHSTLAHHPYPTTLLLLPLKCF